MEELKELRWQAGEREFFRNINKDPFILYPIDTVSDVAHKISLLIQMKLGHVDLSSGVASFEHQRHRLETMRVLEVMNRLIRAVIECKSYQQDGAGCSVALDLARSISAKAWEGTPMQLAQVPQVGKVLMRKLVGSNIRTVVELADTPTNMIERIASRNPPFGKKMADSLASFPRLTLDAKVKLGGPTTKSKSLVDIDVLLGFSNMKMPPKWDGKIPIVTFLAVTSNGVSAFFWRDSLKGFKERNNSGYRLRFRWDPSTADEELVCRFACEEIVGTVVTATLRHDLPMSAFPPTAEPSAASSHASSGTNPSLSPSYAGMHEEISDNDLLIAIQHVSGIPLGEIEDKDDDDGGAGVYPTMDRNGNMVQEETILLRNPQRNHSDISGEEEGAAQPLRLENSNFRCAHPCSWAGGGKTNRGVSCGHQCCRIGAKQPPKPAKNGGKRILEDQEDIGTLASSSKSYSSNPPTKRARTNKSSSQPTALINLDLGEYDEDGLLDLTKINKTPVGVQAVTDQSVMEKNQPRNEIDDDLYIDDAEFNAIIERAQARMPTIPIADPTAINEAKAVHHHVGSSKGPVNTADNFAPIPSNGGQGDNPEVSVEPQNSWFNEMSDIQVNNLMDEFLSDEINVIGQEQIGLPDGFNEILDWNMAHQQPSSS